MEPLILFGTFTVLLLIGTPVAFCLGAASLATVLYMDLPPVIVFQRLNSGVSVFALMAIPFFIFAGELMVRGDIARRLVALAGAVVGHMRGGLGQVNAVMTILKDLGVDQAVDVVGVAKGVDRDAGRERFFIPGKPDFTLPPRDPVLYFIQRLRDEAHRFAIGSHRARRKKEMVRNPLDEITGIGPGRKRALLHHFGTAKAVSRAAVEDLAEVDGISEAMARQIYNHFHEQGA